MRVRAAVLRHAPAPRPYATSRPLTIETIDLAPPGPDEVLVRIAGAGLCHSDLSVINGDRPRPVPLALGHEASAVVEECGPGVTDLARGDHVVMSFVPTCGTCLPCREGRAALCEPGNAANGEGTLLSGARRIRCEGVEVNHHAGVSAFGEYAVVSRHSIVRIDPEIPLIEAALFGCAVMTGVGAVVNTCGVRMGQSVAVVGLGGVGLSALLGAVACGAGRVVAVDLSEDKLRIARELGATDTYLASDPDAVAQIRSATQGGVDHALEMAGSVKAFDTAYRITRRGGTTATAGLAHPTQAFTLPAVGLVGEERVVRGSYMGSCVPARDIPRYIALYRQGRLPVNKLMTGTLALEAINEGFDRLDRGQAVRQVIAL
ncbi:zinc-dependent alcohol dehydrogenase family protein [Methylobacterium isbiliense]|uniref:Alcohol dehydrogenase D n=1 Tax=Methylobacterium isbiliense TaxID=315478 RepID=A0ABQ4S944_9HYPH|nr:zinc-dependent alcohol dehydrogenase family protein [Methylobacterium isbiliense]MDN3627167.1 zinc-dependent alcohol dehydrogenase family protein [Methylobacterium isbiliense]GJD99028.1 Putative alcohol dehydrogenase D [Methylobacterium isbiliense]